LVTNKKGESSCRFFYPRPLAQQPVVTKEINHRDYMFAPARNQAILKPVLACGHYGLDG
jgi:hypothetical protein